MTAVDIAIVRPISGGRFLVRLEYRARTIRRAVIDDEFEGLKDLIANASSRLGEEQPSVQDTH
jgi:hypothetical protein